MDWYLKVLRNYFVFEGRARRKEYWMFILFNFLVSVALIIVDSMLGTFNATLGLGLASGIYSLVVLFPSLAVSVRRLHDRAKSGWWLLIAVIPFIGAIVLLVWFLLEGDQGRNRYGDDPKRDTGRASSYGRTEAVS